MANIKISEMPALSVLTGAEWLPAYDPTKTLAQQNQRLQIQQVLPPGGTTGQIPSKVSNANYDIAWVAPPSGGGGALSVLNIDFTEGEVLGSVSSPVLLSTYTMPGGTVPVTGELIIESYCSYFQDVLDQGVDYPVFYLQHRLGGVTVVSRRGVPFNVGGSGYENFRVTGWVKFETRMQAMNSASVQYNSGIATEVTQNFSDGVHYLVTPSLYGQYPPTEYNISNVNMAVSNAVDFYVECSGTGNATSKLIHRYTRVSLISP